METAGGTGMRTPQRTSLDVGTAAAQTRTRFSEEKVRRSFDLEKIHSKKKF
jgi:hypothetical protein